MKKQKRIVIVLVSIIIAALILIVLFFVLEANRKTYRGQLELGRKYVTEESYEEALICFEAAIKIELKREEAYLCMAEVYEIQQDYESMTEILEEGCSQAKTETLEHGNSLSGKGGGGIQLQPVFCL